MKNCMHLKNYLKYITHQDKSDNMEEEGYIGRRIK